jgi:hypothetical protein
MDLTFQSSKPTHLTADAPKADAPKFQPQGLMLATLLRLR